MKSFAKVLAVAVTTFVVSSNANTCTCYFTADNYVHEVYVDGVNKASSTTNWGQAHGNVKTLNFECGPDTRFAVKASDAEYGCNNGGFSMACTSTDTSSAWNGYKTGQGVGEAKVFTYGSSTPHGWHLSDFDDSSWALASHSTGGNAGVTPGCTTTSCSLCAPGNQWLFRLSPYGRVCGTGVSSVNANDYSSTAAMRAAGWTVPVTVHLGGYGAYLAPGYSLADVFQGHLSNEAVGDVSHTMQVAGRVTLTYGRSYNYGSARVFLNEVQIHSTEAIIVTTGFDVEVGDVIRIGEYGTSVFTLYNINVCVTRDPEIAVNVAGSAMNFGEVSNYPYANCFDDNTNNFCHTPTGASQEDNPWFRVDLGSSHTVGSFRIFNRLDCCMDRIGNYEIYVGGDSAGPTSNTMCFSGTAGSTAIAVEEACVGTGRYVFIRLPGTNRILNVAEIEVYGVPFYTDSPTTSPTGSPTVKNFGHVAGAFELGELHAGTGTEFGVNGDIVYHCGDQGGNKFMCFKSADPADRNNWEPIALDAPELAPVVLESGSVTTSDGTWSVDVVGDGFGLIVEQTNGWKLAWPSACACAN